MEDSILWCSATTIGTTLRHKMLVSYGERDDPKSIDLTASRRFSLDRAMPIINKNYMICPSRICHGQAATIKTQ